MIESDHQTSPLPAPDFELDLPRSAINDGTQCISHDAFDLYDYERAEEDFSRLARTSRDAAQNLGTAEALIRDLYWSFHKRAPQLLPNAPLLPAHAINRQILDEIMSTGEWREMRETGTIGDALTSAMATIGASEKAIAALGDGTVERINKLKEAAEAAEQLFNQAEALEELALAAAEEVAQQLLEKAREARAKAKREEQKARRAAEGLEQDQEERSQAVRQAARQGLKEAIEEAEGLNQALKSFGGGYDAGVGAGSGPIGAMNLKEKIDLAQRVRQNPKLLMVAQLCGTLHSHRLATQPRQGQTST